MIGLAKREEEIFVEGVAKSIILPKDSPALLLLRRIRDEAHRFALTFQRKTREKNFKML
jgi:excinuclease ABC subunit C